MGLLRANVKAGESEDMLTARDMAIVNAIAERVAAQVLEQLAEFATSETSEAVGVNGFLKGAGYS